MKLPFFGVIDLNNLEELYEAKLGLQGYEKAVIELWFDSENISEAQMRPIAEILEDIPVHIKKSEDYLYKAEAGRNCLLEYLNHHIEELDTAEKENFGILESDDAEIALEKMESRVYLKSISLWPENSEIMRIDHTIGHLITDYVMCMGFNAEKVIESIEIES